MKDSDMIPDLFTVAEIAKRMRVSEPCVRAMVAAGKLDCYSLGPKGGKLLRGLALVGSKRNLLAPDRGIPLTALGAIPELCRSGHG